MRRRENTRRRERDESAEREREQYSCSHVPPGTDIGPGPAPTFAVYPVLSL